MAHCPDPKFLPHSWNFETIDSTRFITASAVRWGTAMRYVKAVLFFVPITVLVFVSIGCDDDETPSDNTTRSQPTDDSSDRQALNASDQDRETASDEKPPPQPTDDSGDPQDPESADGYDDPSDEIAPDDIDTSFSVDWEFIIDDPIDDAPANAWARVDSPIGIDDGDAVTIFVASSDIDWVCEEQNYLKGMEKDVEKGQIVLEFQTYDVTHHQDPLVFTGQPGLFDRSRVDIYFYSDRREAGTTSGFGSNPDENNVEIEIKGVTEDAVIGSASALSGSAHDPDRENRASAQFSATICD